MLLLHRLLFVVLITGLTIAVSGEEDNNALKPKIESNLRAGLNYGSSIYPVVNSYGGNLANNIVSQAMPNQGGVLVAPKFNSFLEMDLNYLLEYKSVTSQVLLTCNPGMDGTTMVTGNMLADRLTFTYVDAQAYLKEFELPGFQPDNQALQNYMNFYRSQMTCQAMVSAMQLCLCSYSTIAQQMSPNLSTWQQQLTPSEYELIQNFYNDNSRGSGTSCRYGDALLQANGGIMPQNVYQAYLYENGLWQTAFTP